MTITRQFGSLGRPIAKRLSEILQVEYYDRDIVEETARRMNLPVSAVSDREERSSGFFRMLFPLGTEAEEKQRQLFQVQSGIISRLAAKDSCIIVGRCADYVLAGEKHAIHVYIYAPYEARLSNCVGPLGMQEDTARRMIREVDRARLAYHRRFAHYAPDDPAHKHVIINSALLGVEGTARALAALVGIRQEMGKTDR